jgi:hypothetical protein
MSWRLAESLKQLREQVNYAYPNRDNPLRFAAHRFFKGIFNRPSAYKSVLDSAIVQLQARTPASESRRVTTISDQMIISPIVCLFTNQSPFTILRRVALTVICAFERVIRRRSFAHISNKVLKLQPSVTNRDTTSAITVKVLIAWVPAAVFHCEPYFIFWRLPFAVSIANSCGNLLLQTSATSCVTVAEFAGGNPTNGATVALTNPLRRVFHSPSVPKNHQFAKTLASQVDKVMDAWERLEFDFHNTSYYHSWEMQSI